jgi:hypothetical protein
MIFTVYCKGFCCLLVVCLDSPPHSCEETVLPGFDVLVHTLKVSERSS